MMFDRDRHINNSDRRILDGIFEAMKYEDQERYMAEWDFYPENEYNLPPKNLDEESCNDLLGMLKLKYNGIVALEKALGAELVAELRGLEYDDGEIAQEEMVNENDNCYCSKIVDLEPYEIQGCCARRGEVPVKQWVGQNSHGDFYVATCSCGKISKPILK